MADSRTLAHYGHAALDLAARLDIAGAGEAAASLGLVLVRRAATQEAAELAHLARVGDDIDDPRPLYVPTGPVIGGVEQMCPLGPRIGINDEAVA